MKNFLPRLVAVAAFLFVSATAAHAANVLVNPGFENPAVGGEIGGAGAGWGAFGNVFLEPANPPALVPNSGNQLVKMFGTFNPFGVSGIFQSFPAVPGSIWSLSSHSRHFSGDPMVGAGKPNSNWVVQKIAFFDASNAEIGSGESTILDGTYPTDTWFANAPVLATAPATTVSVQALILYLQPGFDGGAAQIDDVVFENVTPTPATPTSWGAVKAFYNP